MEADAQPQATVVVQQAQELAAKWAVKAAVAQEMVTEATQPQWTAAQEQGSTALAQPAAAAEDQQVAFAQCCSTGSTSSYGSGTDDSCNSVGTLDHNITVICKCCKFNGLLRRKH